MLTVETPRLRLRMPEPADARPLLDIHEHPDVIKHVLAGRAPGGVTGAWRIVAMMIGHWQIRGYGQWTVVERATDDIVGRVGLFNPEGWPGIELGWITKRSHWGKGYATEAAGAALAWAWDHVEVDHIISIIRPDNSPSIRVAEKLGERFEHRTMTEAGEASIYGVYRP
jgi:RimJ/RimL family protein N-acetyltransferase